LEDSVKTAREELFDVAWEWIKDEPLDHQSKEMLAERISNRMFMAGKRYLDEERQYREERLKLLSRKG
jgi:hypothetical protein